MKVNRNVNKYIKDCKHFFPFLSKNEKTFLKRLKTNIIENIDLDNVTYDDLCNEFGYPSNIIVSYFEEQDANYLIKQSRIRNILKKSQQQEELTKELPPFSSKKLRTKKYKNIMKNS